MVNQSNFLSGIPHTPVRVIWHWLSSRTSKIFFSIWQSFTIFHGGQLVEMPVQVRGIWFFFNFSPNNRFKWVKFLITSLCWYSCCLWDVIDFLLISKFSYTWICFFLQRRLWVICHFLFSFPLYRLTDAVCFIAISVVKGIFSFSPWQLSLIFFSILLTFILACYLVPTEIAVNLGYCYSPKHLSKIIEVHRNLFQATRGVDPPQKLFTPVGIVLFIVLSLGPQILLLLIIMLRIPCLAFTHCTELMLAMLTLMLPLMTVKALRSFIL